MLRVLLGNSYPAQDVGARLSALGGGPYDPRPHQSSSLLSRDEKVVEKTEVGNDL